MTPLKRALKSESIEDYRDSQFNESRTVSGAAGGTDSETQTAFAATARELTQHIHSVSYIDL